MGLNRPPDRRPLSPGFFQTNDGHWWYAESDRSRTSGFAVRPAAFTICPDCDASFLATRKAIRRAGTRVPGRLPRCPECRPTFTPGCVRPDKQRDYVRIKLAPDDPLIVMANSMGWCAEHRIVMARAIGRPLEKHETVHHMNGDQADNRVENLQLRSGPHGVGGSFRCADCGSSHIIAIGLGDRQESLL